MIKIEEGDLIEAAKNGDFDVIAHGCNCFNNMGSGIARTIREQFPEAYAVDCQEEKGDRDKLGKISFAHHGKLTIVNCYTQYKYGRDKVHADYEAIRSCMKIINARFAGLYVGLPIIGCGLAGGDWNIVEKIFEEELTAVQYTVMQLPTNWN
jgi:O-acetyl-ADP-ribose deacetylase (regulator of RNase III)